jgi:hypothetical protein
MGTSTGLGSPAKIMCKLIWTPCSGPWNWNDPQQIGRSESLCGRTVGGWSHLSLIKLWIDLPAGLLELPVDMETTERNRERRNGQLVALKGMHGIGPSAVYICGSNLNQSVTVTPMARAKDDGRRSVLPAGRRARTLGRDGLPVANSTVVVWMTGIRTRKPTRKLSCRVPHGSRSIAFHHPGPAGQHTHHRSHTDQISPGRPASTWNPRP